MSDLKGISIKVRNFKCFGEDEQGLNTILPINVIIGKNNSGKSTLIELIQNVTIEQTSFDISLWHKGKQPEIIMTLPIAESALRAVFQERVSGGGIPGANHWAYGSRWVGRPIDIKFNPKKNHECISIDPPFDNLGNRKKDIEMQLARQIKNPLSGMTVKRLLAERDIVPEADGAPALADNGQGATNILQNFINKSTLPSEMVEKLLLDELNKIFNPDSNFTDIVCQHLQTNNWEIYLEEDYKGRIPLSQTGSGLKTILLVLIFLYLLPHTENKDIGSYVFAFEELENNLHPALLRRLLLYLRDIAIQRKCLIFLTSHSNVVIDLFSRDENAQIIHVTHDGEKSTTRMVNTYVENKGVLDDLDIRASDLLQSNGIIWVEGPSDRLYFNRWIELWSNGELREGAHYQCVFYGGRLLAHLTAGEPVGDERGWVKILTVNRNALVLIDSDKKKKGQQLNATKKRIQAEIDKIGGLCWITKGREIENYIPTEALASHYNKSIPELEQYDDFHVYIEKIKTGEGNKFLRNKVLYAEKIAPSITKESLAKTLDMSEKLTLISKTIRLWNGIPT